MLRSRLVAAALTTSTLLLTPALASADWSVETVGTGRHAAPAVALTPGGDLAIRSTEYPASGGGVSRRGTSVRTERVAVRSPGGTFAATVVDGWDELAADRTGRITALSTRTSTPLVATRAPGGAFGPMAPALASGTGYVQASAFSLGGAGALALSDGNGTSVSVRLRGGGFGAPERVTTDSVGMVAVAVADDGQVLVGWERYIGGTPSTEYRLRSAAGTWSAPQSLAGTNGALAMGPEGDAIVVVRGATHYRGVLRPAGGAFGDAVDVLKAESGAGRPQAEIGPGGRGLFVQNQSTEDGAQRFAARPFGPAGLGAQQDLMTGTTPHGFADLVYDADGDAWLAYAILEGEGGRMTVRHAADGVRFGAPATLSSALQTGLDEPRIAAGGHDSVAVLWTTTDRLELATSGIVPPNRGPIPIPEYGFPRGTPPVVPAPKVPVPAPAPRGVSSATSLTKLGATVRRGRVTATFRLSGAAPVKLVVQRRTGRTWRTVGTAKSVRGVAGANRVGLGRLASGRYRVTATVGKTATRAAFRVAKRR